MKGKSCPHCGGLLTKPRSEPDHRRFFAIIHAAFNQWPETHEFQPDNAEHLRAWLLCKAGYRESTFIPVEGDDPAVSRLAVLGVEGALKAARSYAFVRPVGDGLAIFTARSIAWDTLSQKDFGPIREAVEEIISAEIGVDADALLREKAA